MCLRLCFVVVVVVVVVVAAVAVQRKARAQAKGKSRDKVGEDDYEEGAPINNLLGGWQDLGAKFVAWDDEG